MDTNIIIKNVSKENKYKGAYKRIFKILNKDLIFTERYETDDSTGLVDGVYYLTIEGTINHTEHEAISKIKNVFIK
jgi:hypothetical protein